MQKKVALVTGASGGIGGAIALRLAQDGFWVAVHYCHSESKALSVVEEIRQYGGTAIAVGADVAEAAQVQIMMEQISHTWAGAEVDVLVNNAGISQQKLFTDITPAEWRRMMAVHVDGAYNCIRAVLPAMIRRQRGHIINISSMWGQVGASCEVHYSTAKAALIGLTKALAKEVGPSHIQVNCVAPGVIQTAMNAALDETTLHELKSETPLLTLGTPADIAQTVSFLADERSSFITGQILGVNGGFVI